MAQFFSTIGRHLECAIQTELVVELELAIFFRSAAILKVLVRPNWFSNLSEP